MLPEIQNEQGILTYSKKYILGSFLLLAFLWVITFVFHIRLVGGGNELFSIPSLWALVLFFATYIIPIIIAIKLAGSKKPFLKTFIKVISIFVLIYLAYGALVTSIKVTYLGSQVSGESTKVLNISARIEDSEIGPNELNLVVIGILDTSSLSQGDYEIGYDKHSVYQEYKDSNGSNSKAYLSEQFLGDKLTIDNKMPTRDFRFKVYGVGDPESIYKRGDIHLEISLRKAVKFNLISRFIDNLCIADQFICKNRYAVGNGYRYFVLVKDFKESRVFPLVDIFTK